MKKYVTLIISLLLVLTSGILAIGDTMLDMPFINANLKHAWPLFIVGATAVDRMAKIIGHFLAPEQFPDTAVAPDWRDSAAGKAREGQ